MANLNYFARRELLKKVMKKYLVYDPEYGDVVYASYDKEDAINKMNRYNNTLIKNGMKPHWKIKTVDYDYSAY